MITGEGDAACLTVSSPVLMAGGLARDAPAPDLVIGETPLIELSIRARLPGRACRYPLVVAMLSWPRGPDLN
jgi:hypothetical protein